MVRKAIDVFVLMLFGLFNKIVIMRKKNVLMIMAGVLFIVVVVNFIEVQRGLKIQVINVNEGYGYLILAENKLLIKQEYIPGINSKIPFCSSADALKVANIVRVRILEKKSPSITKVELKNLKLRLNCVDL